MPLNSIRLPERQVAVLEWIKAGCPAGVYDDDEHYSHRLSARALASRGLIKIRGHGATWWPRSHHGASCGQRAAEEGARSHERSHLDRRSASQSGLVEEG